MGTPVYTSNRLISAMTFRNQDVFIIHQYDIIKRVNLYNHTEVESYYYGGKDVQGAVLIVGIICFHFSYNNNNN